MNNILLLIIVAIIAFVFGFAYSMSYWYKRAKTSEPISIGDKVYRLIEQDVSPKD